MIRIRNLHKQYNNTPVLSDISLDIEAGEIFGIVGHSGAGKSTLLRCLNGLEPYQRGSLSVMGLEVSGLEESGIKNLRRDMGMIFQNFGLMSRKTVFDNVAFPLELWKTPKTVVESRVMELLDLVGLADRRHDRIQSLSGGQKQRVGIARALALNPKILLCDEATSALDPKTTLAVLDLLQRVNERFGLTIVLVTHQMEVVKRVCYRFLLLDRGVPQCLGQTETLFLAPPEPLKKFVEDEFTVIPSGINIRLMFPRDISQQSIITTMARDLDISFSIVGGRLERYLDDVLGFLIINVDQEHLPAALEYLREKKLHWEVLPPATSSPAGNGPAPL